MAGKLTFVATAGLIGAAVLLPLGVGLSGRDLSSLHELLGTEPVCGPATDAGMEPLVLPLASTGRLVIALPAMVSYQPGGRAEVAVSGDPALVGHVRLDGDKLHLDCNSDRTKSRLTIKVSGPSIMDWTLLGSGDLSMTGIDQPELQLRIRGSGSAAMTGTAGKVEVDVAGSGQASLRNLAARSMRVGIRGSGDVDADGTAESVEVDISGSGKARLKDLVSKSARLVIRGSGDVQVTARSEADVSIYGSGHVELSGHPVLRRSEIKGSGRIVQLS